MYLSKMTVRIQQGLTNKRLCDAPAIIPPMPNIAITVDGEHIRDAYRIETEGGPKGTTITVQNAAGENLFVGRIREYGNDTAEGSWDQTIHTQTLYVEQMMTEQEHTGGYTDPASITLWKAGITDADMAEATEAAHRIAKASTPGVRRNVDLECAAELVAYVMVWFDLSPDQLVRVPAAVVQIAERMSVIHEGARR